MVGVEVLPGGGGDGVQVVGVGGDDEVAAAECAFDDERVDDVGGGDSGGEGRRWPWRGYGWALTCGFSISAAHT
jgi:hypothetical protein